MATLPGLTASRSIDTCDRLYPSIYNINPSFAASEDAVCPRRVAVVKANSKGKSGKTPTSTVCLVVLHLHLFVFL